MKKLLTVLMLTALSFATITTFAQTAPSTTQRLKKDGTPDKRYKSGKAVVTPTAPTAASAAPAVAPATPAAAPVTNPAKTAPVQTPTAATPNTGRHLKKDGTPDMRYKENRTAGIDKNGKPDMRDKANKTKKP